MALRHSPFENGLGVVYQAAILIPTTSSIRMTIQRLDLPAIPIDQPLDSAPSSIAMAPQPKAWSAEPTLVEPTKPDGLDLSNPAMTGQPQASNAGPMLMEPTISDLCNPKTVWQEREKSDLSIYKEWKKEETRVKACSSAISQLERAIPELDANIQLTKQHLKALEDVVFRNQELEVLRASHPRSEYNSAALSRLKVQAANPIMSGGVSPEDKLQIAAKEVDSKTYHMQELVSELREQRLLLTIAKETLQDLRRLGNRSWEIYIKTKEMDMTRPFWRLDEQTWVKIFSMVISLEYSKHLDQIGNNLLRPTALILSQVCRCWRKILDQCPKLWSLVTVHPSDDSNRNVSALLKHLVTKSSQPIDTVLNLPEHRWRPYRDQTFEFNRYQTEMWEGKPSYRWPVMNREFNQILIIDTSHRDAQRRLRIPFWGPVAVSFRCKNAPLKENTFKSVVHQFYNTESLEFVFHPPEITALTGFVDRVVKSSNFLDAYKGPIFPLLVVLRFRVYKFPDDNQIEAFLGPTLRELYIEYSTSVPNEGKKKKKNTLKLPHLQILGLVVPSTHFFQRIQAPALKKLILYGPPDNQDIRIASGKTIDTLYHQITSLELSGWKKLDQVHQNTGVINVFWEVMSKRPALRDIKFTDSIIDGEGLVGGMQRAARNSNPELFSSLEEMTLCRIQGVTEQQCVVLRSIVQKLNIYAN